ncbi:MAG: proline racemase family protein [Anaerolineae bacterium]
MAVETPSGPVQLDISFGGNFFAPVPAKRLGLEVKLAHLPGLVERSMAIRAAIDEQMEVVHPTQQHVDTVDLVEVYEDLDGGGRLPRRGDLRGGAGGLLTLRNGHQRQMAALYSKGELNLQCRFVNESIIVPASPAAP